MASHLTDTFLLRSSARKCEYNYSVACLETKPLVIFIVIPVVVVGGGGG